MEKVILITGGCGFIGTNFIKFILKNKKIKIINIDKLTYAANLNNFQEFKYNKNYIFYKVDICNNAKVKKILNKEKPDMVLHMAAESHVDRSIENPIDFIKTNILGTYSMLQASTNYFKANIKKNFKFYHVSTDEVYGDINFNLSPVNEKHPYRPNSPYSASKASSDHFVRAWHKTYDLPIIISNCTNNYGPYQYPEKLIPHVILCLINNKKIPIYGNGQQIRDWIHVDDHVEGIFKVIMKGKIGQTYNIGGNNQVTNKKVVLEICKNFFLINKQNKLNYESLLNYVEDRPGHDKRYALSIKKIYNELKWKPKISFKDGIKRTVKWYLNNKIWLNDVIKKNNYNLKRIGKIKK